MQAPFLETLYFTKTKVLEATAFMMAQFYTEKRVIRQTKKVNGKFVFTEINSTAIDSEGNEKPFNKMPEHLMMDVDVKEELPFTNARELTARTLSEVMKAVPQTTSALIGPIVNSLSGISDKEQIVQEVRATFQQGGQPQQ